MTRSLALVGLLALGGLLLAIADVAAEEEAAERGSVVGTVVAGGAGTPARLEVFRLGDFDALIGIGDQIERGPRIMPNRLAVTWGVVEGEPIRVLQADAHGKFAIDSLQTGGYVIWARDAKGRTGGRTFTLKVADAREEVTVSLSMGAREVTARVLLRENEPFRGHVVLLRSDQYGDRWKLGRYRTDASGRFVARGVPESDLQLVLVRGDDLAAMSPQYPWPGPERIEWVVAPGEAREISGRVVSDTDGKAIQGAIVEAASQGRNRRLLAVTAKTGADGRFLLRIAGAARGVLAFAPGFDLGVTQLRSGGDAGTVRLAKLHPLRGRVVKKGTTEALAGVRVIAYKLKPRGPRRLSVLTDREGRFSFDGLVASEWMVFAVGNGWVSDGVWDVAWRSYNPFALTLGEGETQDVTLEVVPSGQLEGRVVDGAGKPVPGAVVEPELMSTPASDQRPMWAFATSRLVATKKDGTYRHEDLLPGGAYKFRVTAPRFPRLTTPTVVVKPGSGNKPLRLTLQNDRFLRVRVVDETTNQPVAGAHVQPVIVQRWDPSRLFTADLAGPQGATGEDGLVRLGPLLEGRLGVEVDAPEHEHLRDPVEVPEECTGPNAKPFVVKLEPGKAVAGVLRLPKSMSGAGFLLRAYALPTRGAHPSAARTTRVAADGSFRVVGLRAAPYRLWARMKVEDGIWYGDVEVDAPATTVELVVEFHPTPEPGRRRPASPPDLHKGQHRIRLKVNTPDGKPLAEARVTVHPKQLNPSFSVKDGSALIAVPHDAKEISIEVLGGWNWKPTHGRGMYGPFAATRKDITIDLEKGTTVTGRVFDPDGGGLAGVRVSLLPVDPLRPESPDRYEYWYSKFETRTDAAGRFTVASLRPGKYDIAAAVPPGFIAVDPFRFTLSSKELEIRLRRGIEVEIRVLDDTGKPYAGAEVQARRLEGDPGHESWQLKSQARTGRDGVARLVGLDPKQLYRLGIDPDNDSRTDLTEKRIHDWRPAETEVQLGKE